jgi:hypothetical protein
MKELTVNERAKAALSIDHTEQELTSLSTKFADVIEISNADDYSLVKGACREFQKVRVSIEKAGKSARDDANKFSKAVLSEQKRLLDIVVPEEDRLKALRKEVDDKAVREAAEKLKKEEGRKENIKHKIEYDIRGPANNMFGKDSAELKIYLSDLTKIEITEEEYQELFDYAVIAKTAGVKKLSVAIEEKEELERLRALQEEQEKKQAEEQARIDAENEKIRLAQEAIEKEKREIEAKKLAEAEATARKLKEENEQLIRKQRKKLEREKREQELAAEEARQKQLLPEKNKLLGWLAEIDDSVNSNRIDIKDIELKMMKEGFLEEFNSLLTDYIKAVQSKRS